MSAAQLYLSYLWPAENPEGFHETTRGTCKETILCMWLQLNHFITSFHGLQDPEFLNHSSVYIRLLLYLYMAIDMTIAAPAL